MRKILATLLLVLFLPSTSYAQENRAALAATISHQLPTNSQGLITAAILRNVLNTLVNSIVAITGDVNVIANTVLANMSGGTVKANITGSPAAPSDVSLVSFFGAAPVGSIPQDAIQASLNTDGFTPTPSYATLSVTSSSSRVALPTGGTVVVYNTGTAAAYVTLGSSSVTATTSNDVVQPNSWISYLVGPGQVDLAAITSTGTATLNISGGTGQPAGAGGGGSTSSGSGTFATDESAFTAGASQFTPGGGTYQTSIPSLTSGQQGTFALSSNRSLHTTEDNSAAILSAINGPVAVNTNNGTVALHVCGNHVFKHITSATDTQLVAASGSTTIYVCDYSFSFGGAGNMYLEKATTGTCATLTQLTGQWYGAANVGKIDANPYYRGLNTGASAQLCINTSTFTGPLDIDVYYDQY